jgi:Pregnancy-associated plasma protein-A
MKPLRRVLTLAAALALVVAQATPVLALTAGGAPAWACLPGDTAGSVARGGFADDRGLIREKDTGQVVRGIPPHAQGAAPADFNVTVPVYWHVITNGSLGNITNAQINSQIQVLDAAFAASDFSFTLAAITRTNNATWYASKSAGAEHAMKQALKVDDDSVLNVYTTSGGAYLGWAYLPEITDTAQAYLDGIVIDWRTLPGVSDEYEGVADEGDTLVHEAGHWLNLEHTFFGQCNKTGDYVDDTPAQKSATFGCPVGKDTCPTKPGLDPVTNYMDYSDDSCMFQFTPGQAQRMQDAWLFWRAT